MRKTLVALLLLLTGCPKDAPEGNALLSEVRRGLTEREQRLTSYHLAGESREGEHVATHAFFFRAPNKMHGVVMHPAHLEWSWDGAHLVKLEFGQKRLSRFELKLPAEKSAMFLTSTFAPFVNEGFRTPLMPSRGVRATKVSHPKGPDAVKLEVEISPQLKLTYVLRWPTGDFLSRRSEGEGHVSELTVEEEACDEKLKLCVPRVTVQTIDGHQELRTRLTTIELNADVPADDFAPPKLPEGWTEETHDVVESG
jgi:hypothetical protein